MGEDVIGGRCPSWQAMVSVKNFHRSARARPPPADTPDESSAVTTSQVTPSIQDFAVSLPRNRSISLPGPLANTLTGRILITTSPAGGCCGNFDPTSGEAAVNGLHPPVSQRGYAQNLWNGA
jgi:hypothetical protein